MKTFSLLLTLTLGCAMGGFGQNAKVVAKSVEGIGFVVPFHELLPGLWLTR